VMLTVTRPPAPATSLERMAMSTPDSKSHLAASSLATGGSGTTVTETKAESHREAASQIWYAKESGPWYKLLGV